MPVSNKALLQASHKGKSSSTKAQNGSFKGGHSSSSHKHGHSTNKSKDSTKADNDKEVVVERFVDDERDYRSYAVTEFDAHQEAARRRHRDDLIDVVGKRYE
jgi:hypothetical protein